MDEKIILAKLYDLFELKKDPITDQKLWYIYEWLHHQDLDKLYTYLKITHMLASGNYDTTTIKLPINREPYQTGWKT
jgi:hypothetical protein